MVADAPRVGNLRGFLLVEWPNCRQGLLGAVSPEVPRKSMSDMENTNRLRERGIANVLLLVCATVEAGAQPSSLPALQSVAIEVGITSLPSSEQAALVPHLRAARQMDTIYMRQVWPGTRALNPCLTAA